MNYMKHDRSFMELKSRLYQSQNGCCDRCKEKFSFGDLQLHHINNDDYHSDSPIRDNDRCLMCRSCHEIVTREQRAKDVEVGVGYDMYIHSAKNTTKDNKNGAVSVFFSRSINDKSPEAGMRCFVKKIDGSAINGDWYRFLCEAGIIAENDISGKLMMIMDPDKMSGYINENLANSKDYIFRCFINNICSDGNGIIYKNIKPSDVFRNPKDNCLKPDDSCVDELDYTAGWFDPSEEY